MNTSVVLTAHVPVCLPFVVRLRACGPALAGRVDLCRVPLPAAAAAAFSPRSA